MSEDDKIDHHLRDRLKDQEHPVSDRVWTNIKSTLPPEDSNRGGWGWKNWLTTSAIVATTMVLIYYWNINQEGSDNTGNVVSSGNTTAAQISSVVPSANEHYSTEKNTLIVTSPALSSSSIEKSSETSSSSFPHKPVTFSGEKEKNISANPITSRSNPADKYSIAYTYIAEHPDHITSNTQNTTSPSVVYNINTNTKTSEEIISSNRNIKSETTSVDPDFSSNIITGNNDVVNEQPQNLSGYNSNNMSEVISDNISESEDIISEDSSIVLNDQENSSSLSKNSKEVVNEEKNKEREGRLDKEEKQDEKDIKAKKDKSGKDQEKEKSILPKPMFSIDAYVMPAYTGVTTSSNTNDASYKSQIAHKNTHDRTWATWSYGGRFNYHMTDAIEFSAGIHYQTIEERISATRSINTLNNGISAQSRYTMLAIPLGAAYNFNSGKLRIRLGAACNLQYTLTSETYFYNEQKNDLDVYTSDAEGMNLALQFSGAVVYPISKHFSILTEPTLQYNLNDLNNGTMFFKEKPYLIGLKTGVRVTF